MQYNINNDLNAFVRCVISVDDPARAIFTVISNSKNVNVGV